MVGAMVGGTAAWPRIARAQIRAQDRAQDYPARPVTIIVPYAPGGATEILARIIGQKLEQTFGKPFIVENKPGAGTVIGTTAVAKAAPDGYTLLMASSTSMAVNVTVHKSLPYDPATDLIPLAMVAQTPFMLIVNPARPVRSVRDLIDLAKQNPGKLSYASAGLGSPHHLFGELLKSMTGIEMTHVPYKGSLPALNDVVAGHIDLMFCDAPPAAGMIESGRVRALGISTSTRLPTLPDVPPLAEAGLPGFDVAAWFMVAAPARTPPAIVDTLHEEVRRSLATPEAKDQIAKLGLLPLDSPPVADMQTFVRSEIVRWGKVVQQAGIAGIE
jgi:tripartite-type tricarboxylate transporter receptor subunit TctC